MPAEIFYDAKLHKTRIICTVDSLDVVMRLIEDAQELKEC